LQKQYDFLVDVYSNQKELLLEEELYLILSHLEIIDKIFD
jgi:hypothetical protein